MKRSYSIGGVIAREKSSASPPVANVRQEYIAIKERTQA